MKAVVVHKMEYRALNGMSFKLERNFQDFDKIHMWYVQFNFFQMLAEYLLRYCPTTFLVEMVKTAEVVSQTLHHATVLGYGMRSNMSVA